MTASSFGPLISGYSRAEALADGVLVDVSATASEAGITFPVALTRAAWERFVAVPAGCEGLQDEAGRLWDVVWMTRFAMRRAPAGTSEVLVNFHCALGATAAGVPRRPSVVTAKAVCGPGDELEPVITIMLPEED